VRRAEVEEVEVETGAGMYIHGGDGDLLCTSREAEMSLTHIEIDDEALETAKRLGGHKTKTAAVAKALEEYNERLNRAAALDKYFELAQSWDLERAEAAHRAEKGAYST